MEVAEPKSIFSRLFLKERRPFVSKQDMNWKAIKWFSGIGVVTAMVVILLFPTAKPEKTFHDGGGGPGGQDSGPPPGTQGGGSAQSRSSESLDYLYRRPAVAVSSGATNRDSAMVLPRQGADAKTQLPPGTRIAVKLTEKVIVAGQAIPVIGTVSNDVNYEDDIAIPQGSKLYGEVSFNDTAERASISWKTIEFPDRRLRAISAIALGLDGQAGLSGNVHSEALKNTVGETISRFIGAYAQGSMQEGVLGAAPGGADNGLKSAVAETAKDRADAWAEDMKKEKKWIELEQGQESYAVLDQSFAFRDPGGVNGE